jgi:hypothetical protein
MLLLAAGGIDNARAQEWKGNIVQQDGLPYVHNPAEPMLPPLELDGQLLWSVGGDSEEDEQLLGAIIEIVLDDQHRSYLLDTQLSIVKVFDRGGNFVRSFGREGDGPGEFRRPTGMFYHKTTGLGVIQPMPARIVMFDTGGEPLQEFPIPGESSFMSVSDIKGAGDNLLMALTSTSFKDGQASIHGQLLFVSPSGQVLGSVWDRENRHSAAKVTFRDGTDELMPKYQAGPNGRVYLSPHYDKYEILVYDSQGNQTQVISREYETRRRSDAEMKEMKERFEKSTANMPAVVEFKVNPEERDIGSILVRDNGELWVGSSRSMHDPVAGKFGTFEVFDPQGRYLRNVSVTADYDQKRDTMFFLKDRLYIVKEGLSSIRNAFTGLGMGGRIDEDEPDELQPPEVLCYQVGYVADM